MRQNVNIVCVKHGTKYNEEHVKRLYRMVERNCSLPFSFYCLSDTYIDGINVIPLDLKLDLESYWWKICLFNLDLDGPILYFDLDIVIQNNFDHFFKKIEKGKILSISRYDGGFQEIDSSDHPEALLNSSCLGFYNEHKIIFDKFMEDPDYNIVTFFGLDRFLTKYFLGRFKYLDYIKDYYWRRGGHCYDPKYVEDDGIFVYDPRSILCLISNADDRYYKNLEKYFL